MDYHTTDTLFAVTVQGVVMNYMFVIKKRIMMRQWPRMKRYQIERMAVFPNQTAAVVAAKRTL